MNPDQCLGKQQQNQHVSEPPRDPETPQHSVHTVQDPIQYSTCLQKTKKEHSTDFQGKTMHREITKIQQSLCANFIDAPIRLRHFSSPLMGR